MHFFILVIGMPWAWMFIMGQNKASEKPANRGGNEPDRRNEGGNGGGAIS